MVRLISRQRGGLAALKLTKLFGIDDFPAAKDSGKVLIIIIYCYFIIIIIIFFLLSGQEEVVPCTILLYYGTLFQLALLQTCVIFRWLEKARA